MQAEIQRRRRKKNRRRCQTNLLCSNLVKKRKNENNHFEFFWSECSRSIWPNQLDTRCWCRCCCYSCTSVYNSSVSFRVFIYTSTTNAYIIIEPCFFIFQSVFTKINRCHLASLCVPLLHEQRHGTTIKKKSSKYTAVIVTIDWKINAFLVLNIVHAYVWPEKTEGTDIRFFFSSIKIIFEMFGV